MDRMKPLIPYFKATISPPLSELIPQKLKKGKKVTENWKAFSKMILYVYVFFNNKLLTPCNILKWQHLTNCGGRWGGGWIGPVTYPQKIINQSRLTFIVRLGFCFKYQNIFTWVNTNFAIPWESRNSIKNTWECPILHIKTHGSAPSFT